MSPHDQDLRTTLHRLADSAEPLPVDDGLWGRARAARRRSRVVLAAAVVTVVAAVGGGVALWQAPDREARTASQEVPGGAVPSRIDDPGELTSESRLGVGRASVAFFSGSGQPVVVGAAGGRYHALDLPDLADDRGPLALSPDGLHLAWRAGGRIHVLHLDGGSVTDFPADDEHAEVTRLAWASNSEQLLWNGRDETGGRSGGLLPVGGTTAPPLPTTALRGIPSPSGELVALDSPAGSRGALFLPRRGPALERPLAADLYPDGAAVSPLGWTQPSLVLAEVDGPAGSSVEGPHLALMTSPDRPRSGWTYRILVRDLPQVTRLSVAVDLVPDLDGTSSQQLTHDFGGPTGSARTFLGIELSLAIGLGVAVALAVLMALRWLWRRFA